MILSRIQGGLGNQMFQWACARSLSLQRSCKFDLETITFRFDRLRKFRLDTFPNVRKLLEASEVLNYEDYSLNDYLPINDNFQTFEFPEGNLLLNGYWQSEKYFAIHENVIRNDFDLSSFDYLVALFPDVSDSISLHVRRTDYLLSNDYHSVMSIDYYERAIDLIGRNHKIFVFSDDIDWCKQNLIFDNIRFIDLENEFETMYLMSKAKHNIIANSSFSWWGAWLNSNSEKIVVAPTNWFGAAANLDSSNIVPEIWKRI